jgi:hypothetical protein
MAQQHHQAVLVAAGLVDAQVRWPHRLGQQTQVVVVVDLQVHHQR